MKQSFIYTEVHHNNHSVVLALVSSNLSNNCQMDSYAAVTMMLLNPFNDVEALANMKLI